MIGKIKVQVLSTMGKEAGRSKSGEKNEFIFFFFGIVRLG